MKEDLIPPQRGGFCIQRKQEKKWWRKDHSGSFIGTQGYRMVSEEFRGKV